jgi:hypothetical protein
MRRRLGVIAVVLLSAVGIAGVVAWALFQTPDFYREELSRPVAPVVRQSEAKVFIERTQQLVEDVKASDEWSQEFEQNQVNSWIIEELQGRYADLIPPGVSDPRIQFSDGSADLGFRYVRDNVTSVVSVRVRPFVPGPNQIGFEVSSIRAGLLPLPIQHVIDEAMRRTELTRLPIERKRSDDSDVFVVNLEGELPEGATVEHVAITRGRLIVKGRGGAAATAESPEPAN